MWKYFSRCAILDLERIAHFLCAKERTDKNGRNKDKEKSN